MKRLSLATLPSVPVAAQPPIDPRSLSIGIVHLGIGAFHRAHQAAFTQAAIAANGDLRWGICGVTQRTAGVVRQLEPQDGLYTILERGAEGTIATVAAAVRRVVFAGDQAIDVPALIAAPGTHIVTLTVTEKGYRQDPATGRLRHDDPAIRAEVDGAPARTVVGQLVRGLQARQRTDAGPLTIVSCDNLPGNGRVLRGLVRDFCAMLPEREATSIAAFVDAHVTFPSTMVDRIVPATTDKDRAAASAAIGLSDDAAVVAEPFSQWVIEDAFAGPRPAWESAGATLTKDVAPYEAMKLRLLNGSHSALAYLGSLAGHLYVSDVMRFPHFVEFAIGFMDIDVTPGLDVPADFDLGDYKRALLERWSNPALRHSTLQIAMDGSQKLPQRLLDVIRERLLAGAEPVHACLAVAGWMRFVTARRSDSGQPIQVDDPLAATFARIGETHSAAGDIVDAMLAVREVFGDALPEDETFRRLVVDAFSVLQRAGADVAVRSVAGGYAVPARQAAPGDHIRMKQQ